MPFAQQDILSIARTYSESRLFPSHARAGLTLVELLVVLVVLVTIAGLVIPQLSGRAEQAAETVTWQTMLHVRDAIGNSAGYEILMRYARDETGNTVGHASGLPWPSLTGVESGRADHPQLAFLFIEPSDLPPYDPVLAVGWREPWLDITSAAKYTIDTTAGFSSAYGVDDDPTPIDGWGNAVVIQLPDVAPGIADIELEAVRLVSAGPNGQIDTPANVLTPSLVQKSDDVVLYLRREDPFP